ncbi:hypothetical protein [Thalassococcus lentus]|uniref:Lipoprotein n=1 Tax=Thalassococcus lentus TaxID=1210524 RepID=A0ABT4XV96_9RHOB|nr:hypothetical protein [Thalassococcus lentus]MDA7425888.1 hypothetical protein [Thalassococcus lentus]
MPARWLSALTAVCLLAACEPLDTEEGLRHRAQAWLFLGETRAFAAGRDCAVARVDLISPAMRERGGPLPVSSVREAIPHLQAGTTIAFVVPGATPNQVSEQLMSAHLFEGLGMLSTFVGPGRRCMDDVFAAQAYTALMDTQTLMIFDPKNYVMVLLYRPIPTAFVIRTKGG